MESDDEVQEIDPPVIMRSGHKNTIEGYCKKRLTLIFVVIAKESTKM
jgi:hypothetical protein